MKTVPFDSQKHLNLNISRSNRSLKNYLEVVASQPDGTRTFVLEAFTEKPECIGCYTLGLSSINHKVLPKAQQMKLQSVTSAGLITRLVVGDDYRGKGFGEWLLIDALRKLLGASDSVDFSIVVADVQGSEQGFYQHYGFKQFPDTPDKLFMTLSDVRVGLGSLMDIE